MIFSKYMALLSKQEIEINFNILSYLRQVFLIEIKIKMGEMYPIHFKRIQSYIGEWSRN